MEIYMEKRPVIAAICGIKNSGKTTLIETLTSRMSSEGLRVAVIKHDGHDFSCDVPDTDTDRCSRAGAIGVAAFSSNRIFLHRSNEGWDEKKLISFFPDADVILIEGLKNSNCRKIELVRKELSRKPVSNPEGRILIVSDLPQDSFEENCAGFEETDRIIQYILQDGLVK